MNSQEVRDLLLLTDSDSEENQMFDDDTDNDLTYFPEPGSDTSSEDESPRKRRKNYQGSKISASDMLDSSTEHPPGSTSTIVESPTEHPPGSTSTIVESPTEHPPGSTSTIVDSPAEHPPGSTSTIVDSPAEHPPGSTSTIVDSPAEHPPGSTSTIVDSPAEHPPGSTSTIVDSPAEHPPGSTSTIVESPTEHPPGSTSTIVDSPAEHPPGSTSTIVDSPAEHSSGSTPLIKKKRPRTVEERNKRDAASHPVKKACTDLCKLGCNKTFGNEDRVKINKEFWSLHPENRRQFVWNTIKQEATQRHTTNDSSRRSKTYRYFLRRSMESGGGSKAVCKVFYLTTLGYNEKSDSAVMRILHSAPIESTSPAADKRGKHEPKNKLDRGDISHHISKFNPAVHHYRREHAPNRLYLPSDITITDMHADFCREVKRVCLETYRKEVERMNISFAVLGAEECERCKKHSEHMDDRDTAENCGCERCQHHSEHIRRRDEARAAYKMDAGRTPDDQEVITSVDLQKVMMLPRLPGVKSCAFTRRIVVFNETFAGLGTSSNNVAVVWNESVSGRNADDICSAYWNFFKRERDAKSFILWGDNCSAQNKNWTFFSFLATAVNSQDISANEITFKYLETGHTFMAADSVHHSIERELKKCGDVRDFQEYIDTLERARCKVICMGATNFKSWRDHSNRATINKGGHKLSNMAVVQFRRGARSLFYKKAHGSDSPFLTAEFLKKKSDLSVLPEDRSSPRGITAQKKDGIVKNVCPLMPRSRALFWEQLPTNDGAVDLINSF